MRGPPATARAGDPDVDLFDDNGYGSSRGFILNTAVPFDLTWHERTSDIPQWLWDACFGPPREGLFWFRALEAGKLEQQFTFLYGVLLQDGAAIGIVPAFLHDLSLDLVIPPAIARFVKPLARGPFRRLGYQRTLFVGNVAGDEGHVGLTPGHALRASVTFIQGALREKARALKAPMLVWKDFPTEDREALDQGLCTGSGFRIPSYPSTVIPLVRGGYAAFLATQRSDRRRKINNKLQRSANIYCVTTTVVPRPGEVELDEMFALFQQTYLRGKTKFERLTPDYFRAIAECEESTFIVQRNAASGRMVAFMLMLDLGQRIINQFIGIDYASTSGGFPHFRLFAAAYDWACTTQAAVMQSGQTGYMAKLDLGHALVPLWNYCEHRNSAVNWIYQMGAAGISWETLDDQLAEYLRAHPQALGPI